jgi:hypothetical protein
MNSKINIGTTIDLGDLIKSRMLIQANSGGGKSAIARVMMEQSLGKVPFIVLDIEGEYFTLKELNGDIIVIGGQHADVQISIALASKLPKFIIENRLNVVIDVSDLEMNGRIRFAKIFLESLMQLPQQYWVSYLIFLEECHKLAGEQDKYESGPAVKDLMSRGRKRGYCGIPITQRISKLHKDVAAECNNKFIGRTYLDIDMDRSAKELGFSKSTDRLKLRDLKPGCFYAFGTSITPHEVHEVKINKPTTSMPQAGNTAASYAMVPTSKVLSLLTKLNDEVLKVEEKKAPKGAAASLPNEEMKKELEKLQLQLNNTFAEVFKYKSLAEKANSIFRSLATTCAEWNEDLSAAPTPTPVTVKREIKQSHSLGTKPASNGVPAGGAMRMLKAAAMMHPSPISKFRMAALARLSHSSGSFSTYIATLKREGLLISEGNQFQITAEGLNKVGDIEPLPTDPKQLIEMWCEVIGNSNGASRILRVLGDNYPEEFTKENLGSEVEMSHASGSFSTYLSTLKRNGLIQVSGGRIKASPELFN